MTHLLLSGRPGAGKTHVGKWLDEQHGFRHIETDTPAGMQTLNELLKGGQTPQSLGENVVIEWGFAIEDSGLVRKLRDAGFDAWWFDGDEEAARQGYIQRRGDSPEVMDAYWAQAGGIQQAWPELESFYGDDHIIRTVTSGPAGPEYLTCAEIVSTMLPDDAED